MVESNHIKIGWNKKTGRFEYELGVGIRLSDLAMFSLYLQEMALENVERFDVIKRKEGLKWQRVWVIGQAERYRICNWT